MLEDLIEITDSLVAGSGAVYLMETRLEGDALNLTLQLYPEDQAEEPHYWTIECLSYLESRVSLGSCNKIELHYDHPVLWPYIYPEASVSFYGEVNDPLAVIGGLFKKHTELADEWVPFGGFMNGNLFELISGRYGMLAEGPLPLIQGYAAVLEGFGIGTKITEPKAAPYTNDEMNNEVAVLILNRESLVVSQKFYSHEVR